MRQRMNPAKDRSVFRSTYDRVKSINLFPTQMRGGYRL